MTKRASNVRYTGGSNEAGASVQRCVGPEDCAEKRPVTIRIAVFFDGTLNNRTNVLLGQQNVFKGTSYENGLTNVAILERFFDPNSSYEYSFSLYIEGVGTTDERRDTKIAAALGKGTTGVLDKVGIGASKLINRIKKQIDPNVPINLIHIDCFGFSRGAAAARHFIYKLIDKSQETLKQKLVLLGYSVNQVDVKFVGLYDTVASCGVNHEDDTRELSLDAIKHAEQVVQIAAADEHRKNFPLTNVNSAPRGVQIFIPGAHSDVGGGYLSSMDEIDLQILDLDRIFGLTEADNTALHRERRWLIESGWCFEEEIHEINNWYELRVTRRSISNCYSRIPLKMMAGFASSNGVNFTSRLLIKNAIPPALKEVESLLSSSCASSPDFWTSSNTPMLRALRHNYLHFSAYYGSIIGCNEPYFTDGGPVYGRRKRVIHDG